MAKTVAATTLFSSSGAGGVRVRLLCLLGGCLATLSVAHAADDDAVSRGEYIATAASCFGCHMREDGDPYAGGLPIESPFGTLYSSNITPDEETGIGSWSEEDFKRSLHQGYGKEKGYLYPAMPYNSYTKITDEDVSDLWAYFQSIEPVSYEPPENEMVFPANIRTGLALWQELEFEPGRFEPDDDRDDEYNRGAYLVEALGHCSACHSPRNLLMGVEEDRRYTGAEIHGWYAPAIGAGPLSAIQDWSIDELASYLATGTNADNEKVVGEMSSIVHDSLGKMTDEDVRAMATYLKEMPPPADVSEDETEVEPLSEARRDAGRALYAQNCLGCHQSGGKGIDGGVPALAGSTTVVADEPNNIVLLILEGHNPEGTWAAMPSYANEMSSSDIADVVNYVRSAWGNDAPPDATVELVQDLRDVADIPEEGIRASIDCPALEGEALGPLMDVTNEEFASVREDKAALRSMVQEYRAERTESSVSDVVSAMSSAYCRSLAQGDMSGAEQQSRISAFAGEVAQIAEQL